MIRSGDMKTERGNALVLSVLILLALTSVGVVSIQRTNTDLLVAGNVARSMQAQFSGEAGATQSAALTGRIPQGMAKIVIDKRNSFLGLAGVNLVTGQEASEFQGLEVFKSSSAVPDPQGADRNYHMPIIDNTNPLAVARQAIAMDVDMVYEDEIRGWMGYDVDSDICHIVFDMTGRGGIPTGAQDVNQTLCSRYRNPSAPPCNSNSVVVETRARIVAGPIKCTK